MFHLRLWCCAFALFFLESHWINAMLNFLLVRLSFIFWFFACRLLFFFFFFFLSAAYDKDWKRKLVHCLKEDFLVLEVNHPKSTIGFEATKASPNFEWNTWENKQALKTNLKTLIALLNFVVVEQLSAEFSLLQFLVFGHSSGVYRESPRDHSNLYLCVIG